jgi:hypothetical protein
MTIADMPNFKFVFISLVAGVQLVGCSEWRDDMARNSLMSAEDTSKLEYCLNGGRVVDFLSFPRSGKSSIQNLKNPRKVHKCYKDTNTVTINSYIEIRNRRNELLRKDLREMADAAERIKVLKMEMRATPKESDEAKRNRILIRNKIDYCNTPSKYRYLGYWKTKSERRFIGGGVWGGEVGFLSCYDNVTDKEVQDFMQP